VNSGDALARSATPSAEAVHLLVRRHAPSFWRDRPIHDGLRLDDTGIGFDSVALVELLVACESELRIPLPGDLFLEEEMTVGDLVAALQRAQSRA
jgi:acyl carrier protein